MIVISQVHVHEHGVHGICMGMIMMVGEMEMVLVLEQLRHLELQVSPNYLLMMV